MPHKTNHVESTPLGPVLRGPNELIRGVSKFRKNQAADAAKRKLNAPPGVVDSILSGQGLRGSIDQRRALPTTGAMDDAGITPSRLPTASPGASTLPAPGPAALTGARTEAEINADNAAQVAAGRAGAPDVYGTGVGDTGGSPAGKVIPGAIAIQSPAYVDYLNRPSGPQLPSGIRSDGQNSFTNVPAGSYGSGGGPSGPYDRAAQAALVQSRRDAASAFLERGRGRADRREANLRRRANARLSGDMGVVDFVVAAANRKNARDELTQLIGERGKDRRSLLDAETSMRNTDVTQAGQTQRTLISEAGDTSRAQASQRATAALEQYKQGQSNFRTTLKEIASTDRKTMDINAKKFLAEFKSNDEFLKRSAEELNRPEGVLKHLIAQGVLPKLNQERIEEGKQPFDLSNIAALPPTELVTAVAAAAQFIERDRGAQDWLGQPAVDAGEAIDLATTNRYGMSIRRAQDEAGQR